MKHTKLITGLLILFVIVFGVSLILVSPGVVQSSEKKINFSHQKHKDLAECNTCHTTADASERADENLFPKPDVCASCHEEKDIRSYWNLDESVKLADVSLPHKNRHLVFSHKFHLTTAKMDCKKCHGILLTAENEKEVSGIPGMTVCTDCHTNANKNAPIIKAVPDTSAKAPGKFVATLACEACHTTLAGLHPKNHRYANFRQDHGKFAMVGGNEQECAACHSQSFCQGCHTPYNKVQSVGAVKNYNVPQSPNNEPIDSPDRLDIQKVHNLTYRFTHGFDARAQSSRCFICHEQESFCTPCHQNGYDEAGVRIITQSHQLAGFVTLGGNKAMNRHGKLAAMNIESCVTCHNVDGADPICATCHGNGFGPKGGN